MIQANDLRRGNLVASEMYKRNFRVKSISETAIEQDDSDYTQYLTYDKIQGIPLSPEILVKSGFVKHGNSNEYWTFWVLPTNNWHICEAHHTEASAGVETGKFYYGDDYILVEYLHDLQNLYYVLNRKTELNINL